MNFRWPHTCLEKKNRQLYLVFSLWDTFTVHAVSMHDWLAILFGGAGTERSVVMCCFPILWKFIFIVSNLSQLSKINFSLINEQKRFEPLTLSNSLSSNLSISNTSNHLLQTIWLAITWNYLTSIKGDLLEILRGTTGMSPLRRLLLVLFKNWFAIGSFQYIKIQHDSES